MKQDNTKLAVKCNNGTFVGKETDELIIWKGIPYGMQKDIFERREDLMMSWAERLGNGSSKRVC